MEKKGYAFDAEIKKGLKEAEKAEQLFQLLSTYNAYHILLLKAKAEYERKKARFRGDYLYSDCYESEQEALFSLFSKKERLKVKQISELGTYDMLFLLDSDTILRLTYNELSSYGSEGLDLDYEIIKIHDCEARAYTESIYCRDPYYCDTHYEDKDAFGFFCGDSQITPGYQLNSSLQKHNNKDIRKVLNIQSIETIEEKMEEAKKRKILVLTK